MTENAPYQGGAFQPPPAYSGPARPLRTQARLATAGLVLVGGEALFAAGLQAFLLPAVLGETEPTSTHFAVESFLLEREQGIFLLLFLIAGITFIAWLHRARTNLDGPGEWELRWTRGWTIGSWFLPLANFVIPQLVVGEVDRASERRANEAEGRQYERHRGLLVAWSVLWSLFLVFARLGRGWVDWLAPGTAVLLSSTFALVEAAAAICAILLVRRITANQERLQLAVLRSGQTAQEDSNAPRSGARPW